MTLLGIGGVPASHPLNLGMMGMHGEAWVNHAIQEADLLIALGMRFDDRVTGNLKTYAPNAQEDPRRHRPAPRSTRTCAVDVALVGDLRDVARATGCRASRRATASAWLQHIDELKGDAAVRDIQTCPTTGICTRRT